MAVVAGADVVKGVESMEESDEMEILEDWEDDDWCWCLHCCRVFQAKDLVFDGHAREGCPWYAQCGGAGVGCDIHRVQDDSFVCGIHRARLAGRQLVKGERWPMYVGREDGPSLTGNLSQVEAP